MADIDRLEVQIEAQATKANNQIEKLVGNLQNISSALSGINTSGLSGLANGVGKLSSAMKGMKDVGTADFTRLSKNIQKIGNIDKAGMNRAASAMGQMSKQLSSFSAVAKSSEQIGVLAKSISQLGYKSATKSIENIPKLASAMRQLMAELSKAPKVSRNLIDMTNALASLAKTGASSGRAATSLSKSISSVYPKTKLLSTGVSSLSGKLRLFGSSAERATFKTHSLASAFGKLYASYWLLFRAFGKIKESINIASDVTEVQNVVDVTFGKYSQLVDKMTESSIQDYGMSELTTKQISSRFQAMGTAMGFAQGQMADMSITLTKLAADMASFYNVEQSDVAQDLESVFTGMTRPLRQYGLDLTEATLSEWAMKNGLDADVKSMSQAEKTMLRYKYVLANTGAAQGDFARTSDTWANQTRILKQQLQQLATIIGRDLIFAFKPLIKAMNAAMKNVIQFATVVSDALGKIFGWKYEVSDGGVINDFSDLEDLTSGIDDNTDDVSGNMKDTVESAKKLKDYLLGIDELNVLSPDSDFSTSSGNGNGSGNSETPSSSQPAIDYGKWTKTDSILKEFESEIDSLYELGKYIGETISKSLEGIKWDKVYEKARGFGKGLADFLNGLISPELFADVGTTIGNSINTALHFLDSFGETFDFKNFGKSIASGINAALKAIDWKLALKTAKEWGKGIADTLSEILRDTDWTLVGKSIANGLNVAVNFVVEFLGNLDWEQLGKALVDIIGGFFKEFDWKKLAEAINSFVHGLEKAISSAIKNLDWKSVFKAIGDFFGSLSADSIVFLIGAAAIKTFGKLFSTVIAESIKLSLVDSIKGAITGGAISESISGSAAISGISSLATTIAGVGTSIGGVALAASSFFKMWKNGMSASNEALMVLGVTLAGIGAVLLGAPAGIAAIAAAAVAAVGTIVLAIHDNWPEIKAKFKELSTSFQENVVNPIKEKSQEMWQPILDFANPVIETAKDVMKPWVEKFGEAKESAINFAEKTAESFKKIYETQKENLEPMIKTAGELKSTFGELAQFLADKAEKGFDRVKVAYEKISEKTSEVFGKMHDIATEKWQGMWDKISPIATGMSEKLSGVFGGISEVARNTASTMQQNVLESFSKMQEIGGGELSGLFTVTSNVFMGIANTVMGKSDEAKQNFVTAITKMKDTTENTLGAVANTFSEKFDKLKSTAKSKADSIKDSVSSSWSRIKENTSSTFESVKNTVSTKFDSTKQSIGSSMSSIISKISTGWNNVRSSTSSAIGTLKNNVSNIFSGIASSIGSHMSTAKTSVSNAFSGIASSIGSHMSTAKTSVSSAFESISNTMSSKMSNAKTSVGSALQSIAGAFKSTKFEWGSIKLPHFSMSGSFNAQTGTVPKVNVSWYKNGGFPNTGELFIARENGLNEMVGSIGNRNAVANNDQIVEGITSGVYSAVESALAPYLQQIAQNTRETADKDMNVNIGDKEIARASIRGQRQIGMTLRTT